MLHCEVRVKDKPKVFFSPENSALWISTATDDGKQSEEGVDGVEKRMASVLTSLCLHASCSHPKLYVICTWLCGIWWSCFKKYFKVGCNLQKADDCLWFLKLGYYKKKQTAQDPALSPLVFQMSEKKRRKQSCSQQQTDFCPANKIETELPYSGCQRQFWDEK